MSYASESCIQELLAASDSGRGGGGDDGWKVLVYQNGVEISKRRAGPAHVFRSRWLLQDVSPEQFMAVANAVDAAKVTITFLVHHTAINCFVSAGNIIWLNKLFNLSENHHRWNPRQNNKVTLLFISFVFSLSLCKPPPRRWK